MVKIQSAPTISSSFVIDLLCGGDFSFGFFGELIAQVLPFIDFCFDAIACARRLDDSGVATAAALSSYAVSAFFIFIFIEFINSEFNGQLFIAHCEETSK